LKSQKIFRLNVCRHKESGVKGGMIQNFWD